VIFADSFSFVERRSPAPTMPRRVTNPIPVPIPTLHLWRVRSRSALKKKVKDDVEDVAEEPPEVAVLGLNEDMEDVEEMKSAALYRIETPKPFTDSVVGWECYGFSGEGNCIDSQCLSRLTN
jgi:hypothetical protein